MSPDGTHAILAGLVRCVLELFDALIAGLDAAIVNWRNRRV